MRRNVAILISGGGSNMVKLVESMRADHPGRPCVVLSNDPEAGGLQKAADWGIPIAVVDHRPHGENRGAFESELLTVLQAHEAEIVCLAGFMRVLTETFVGAYHGNMLNIHPSLLPKYRGLHTHKRALEAGDHEAGCTVHEVTAALDDGPILGQARVPIEDEDTPQSLAARVLTEEHRLYPAVLRRYAAGERAFFIS